MAVSGETNGLPFQTLNKLNADNLPSSVEEFLHQLKGPTHIVIKGVDRSRCRAVVTLIHGNEPSGFYAVYNLLKNNIQPAVTLHILIPSVVAALTHPQFSHRMLPKHQDLNRCFKTPYIDQIESQLAKSILSLLDKLQPEAIVDIHNTSGSGPAFAVTTFADPKHNAMLSYFTHRLIITDLRLGALMEHSTQQRPIITVECGGSKDHESHAMAYHGLVDYAQANDVLNKRIENLETYQHPLRVELCRDATLSYDDEPVADCDLTLVNHIEDFNFGSIDIDTVLGYMEEKNLSKLRVKSSLGYEAIENYFGVDENQLRPRQALKLFMITSNIRIAVSDCLFYFVTIDNKDRQFIK